MKILVVFAVVVVVVLAVLFCFFFVLIPRLFGRRATVVGMIREKWHDWYCRGKQWLQDEDTDEEICGICGRSFAW